MWDQSIKKLFNLYFHIPYFHLSIYFCPPPSIFLRCPPSSHRPSRAELCCQCLILPSPIIEALITEAVSIHQESHLSCGPSRAEQRSVWGHIYLSVCMKPLSSVPTEPVLKYRRTKDWGHLQLHKISTLSVFRRPKENSLRHFLHTWISERPF